MTLMEKTRERAGEIELHLCVVMSDSYFDIYKEIFHKTLPMEFGSVNILHIRDLDSEPGAVGEDAFKLINFKRLEFVSKQLAAHKGDNLLVLDIDAVFFRDFKADINKLLETNDMVFQYNPQWQTEQQSPFIIATWGLQCSQKNIDFFARQIMPRAAALLLSKEEWDTREERGEYLGAHVPGHWFAHRWGEPPVHLDGDGCVVNAAILESKFGHELKTATLPETYTMDHEGGPNPEECVLYQSAGVARGIQEKATTLVDTYYNIKGKIKK